MSDLPSPLSPFGIACGLRSWTAAGPDPLLAYPIRRDLATPHLRDWGKCRRHWRSFECPISNANIIPVIWVDKYRKWTNSVVLVRSLRYHFNCQTGRRCTRTNWCNPAQTRAIVLWGACQSLCVWRDFHCCTKASSLDRENR